MKVGAAALSGGVLGVLGTLCFFLAFATDYWLVASDDCGRTEMLKVTQDENGTVITVLEHVTPSALTLHHEGFFWRCVFPVEITAEPHLSTLYSEYHPLGDNGLLFYSPKSPLESRLTKICNWITAPEHALSLDPPYPQGKIKRNMEENHCEGENYSCDATGLTRIHLQCWEANQPESKVCIHGYLFPLPVAIGPVPHPMYDPTAVFRGFWTVLIVLALLCALIGGFLLVCGVPFYSHKLYRVGGALLIAAACLFLAVLLLYVMWVELVDVRRYILQENGKTCPAAEVQIHYGLSFMVGAAGVPLVLVSGITFMCIARALGGDKF